MLNNQFSINRIGGGNFEESELTKPRNVLIKGRLSLFVGAMTAALFVSVSYHCTTDFHRISPLKHLKNALENGRF